jgi:sigma-B regulation protein RsbU (phosphoserine phosphatase)
VPDEVYAEREVTLAPGDALCFYTDGLVEARNEIGELFGDERVTTCLTHSAAGEEDLLAQVLECQRRFRGGVPLSDDVTVAVCRIQG